MPKDQVQVRPVEDADRHQVLNLCGEIFQLDQQRLEKVWDWLFQENPAARGQPVQGWVLEANGEIVGHSGVIAQRFCVLGRELLFSFATAFCVLPQYRFHGIRLAHEFLTHTQSEFPLTNSGNESTVAIYKFFGCEQIPGMADNDYIWSIRADRLVRQKLKRVPRGSQLSIVRYVAALLRWMSLFLTYVVWERYRSPYIVEQCEHVGEEFNRLWEDLSRSYGVLSVRSREYLTWRYFQHPEQPYRFFAARSSEGKLVGYAVYWCEAQGSGLRMLHIVDLFCDHTNPRLVMALAQKMILEARRLNADAVRIRDVPDPLRRLLKKRGFLRCKRINKTAYRNSCGIPSEVLSDGVAWYCSSGDGDVDMRIWPAVSG